MRQIRISILVMVSILLIIGTVMIYSSSGIYAYEKYGDSLFFLKRQIVFLCIGILLSLAVLAIDYHQIQKFSKPLLLVSLVLLLLVLVPSLGSQVSGARRWFKIWRFSFQPSELVKLSIIIYLADILSRKGPFVNKFTSGFLPPLLVSGFTIGLILLQPDLGTAISIGCITFILFFAVGVSWKYLAYTLASTLPILAILVFKVPYRMRRIAVFLNPWADPQGSGFQIIQSFLALGSGGLFGLGLGMSRQKLLYLPAAHTDFIFSIIGEELGLIGTASVTILFIALIWQAMRIAFKTRESFGRLLSLGVSSLIAVESIVNIGVSTGSLPTKGLPLPFISYGGSSLIFHMMAIALLLNIARER